MRPSEGKPSSRTTPIASRRSISQELSISWTAAWSKVSPTRARRKRSGARRLCAPEVAATETRRYGYLWGSNLAPSTPHSPMPPCCARYPHAAARLTRNRVPPCATASSRPRGHPVTATPIRAVHLPRQGRHRPGQTPVARDHRASVAIRPSARSVRCRPLCDRQASRPCGRRPAALSSG
jgi:hypothetical protein